MPMIPEDINADITPTQFEKLIHDFLNNLGKDLTSFKAKHDVKISGVDGEYQIDVLAEFDFLGASFKVIVECKRHKNKIKREKVQLVYDKLRSTGAHKGMLFSTSGFQSGAERYAKEHGIALIRVVEGRFTYLTKSQGSQNFEPPPWADIPDFVGEYKNENTISYLQDNYLDTLTNFLFIDTPPNHA